MELSVIILNYNAKHFLNLCLKSVLAATQDLDAEIIVADNHSQDGSTELVKQHFPQVKLLAFDQNHGFSKGNNLAVEQASGEYLCILNPDTVVPEQVFVECLAFARSLSGVEVKASQPQSHDHKKLGFLGVRLMDGSGTFLPESKRHIPTPEVSRQKILGNDSNYYFNKVGEFREDAVDILVGAFMFCKANVYKECGGFDNRYFMYGEDIDLSYTALQKGFQNYYLGSQTVLHFKGESTVKDKVYLKRFYGAMELFYDKYFKRNRLEKWLVKAAAKLFVLVKSSTSEKVQEVQNLKQIFVSETGWQGTENLITRSLESVEEESSSELIFDTSSYSFSEILTFIKEHRRKFKYRFYAENTSTILGSDDANARGAVKIMK
ncbi:glycosyl transferase family 2 [Nonlabens spongiae]|uniref:Glycosyl transferase family 2 n=1 Tax=Nonlabens spongiae TaxID=331648 RepID=A0A1W6MJ94_9FLAO|nr:glycosyltransferase family 2 protein [Nonlabens spongiae]ARN77681.1 glycosyl transferase family 2 [Nonlabens spongiae]